MLLMPVRWPQFKRSYFRGHEPALFSELMRSARPALSRESSPSGDNYHSRLAEMVPDMRWEALLSHVRKQVAQTLRMKSPDSLDIHKPFLEMGLDSLMGIDLTKTLSTSFGTSLPATLLYQHSTVNLLTKYLLNELFAPTESSPNPQPSPQAPRGHGLDKDFEMFEVFDQLTSEKLEELLEGAMPAERSSPLTMIAGCSLM